MATNVLRTAVTLAFLIAGSAASAVAAEPGGNWLTAEGKAVVRIAACGPALCGTIVSLKEPKDEAGRPQADELNENVALRSRPVVGIQVVIGMKPSGTVNQWVGHVYNPEDGKTYDGYLTLQDANTIKIQGCVLGGMLCQSEIWKRKS